MKYQCCGIALLAIAGCRPGVELLEYDRANDQILFLYAPEGPEQVFYRQRGEGSSWNASGGTTIEQPPPVSGPWKLQREWNLVFASDGRLAAELKDCAPEAESVQVTASRFSIKPCAADQGTCCREGAQLVVGANSSCRVPEDWASDPSFCVVREP